MVTPERKLILLDFGLSRSCPKATASALRADVLDDDAERVRDDPRLPGARLETKSGDTSTFLLITRRMLARSETAASRRFTEEMTDELFEAIRQDPVVKVPSDFVLVGRVFSFLSGIAHTLGSRRTCCGDGRRPPADTKKESMATVEFAIFDGDNHYYEAEDAFTRHVDRKMRRRCMTGRW